MTQTAPADAGHHLTVLRNSHERLAALIADMSDAEIEAPSYASDWSVAQVLSHIGSGAEIFALFLAAGQAGDDAPGAERFQPVWAEWNAKSPHDQAHDAVRVDARFLDQLDALSDAERASWQLDMFGGQKRLTDILAMRIGEHALHTWDVAVMTNPASMVSADAVAVVVDNLGMITQYTGKPPADPLSVTVTTESPARAFDLTTTADAVSLMAADGTPGAATIRLPAEALVRLVYGRLDAAHTPPVDVSGVTLDELRAIFPGP